MVSSTAVIVTQFSEDFEKFIAANSTDGLAEIRRNAFSAFGDIGFPSLKNEDWKYTNVASIGNQDWKVSGGKTTDISAEDIELVKRFNIRRTGFTALNLAFADIKVIRIPKETSVSEPIEISFAAGENTAILPHLLIIAEAGSKATVIETYDAAAKSFTNAAVQIFVEDNADLTHYRIQRDAPEAFNVGTTEVELGRASRYDSTNINFGGAISRHDIDLKFAAEGGEAFVDGLYMVQGTQHADTHSVIDHQVPNCISHQTYKGVMNDNSRAVFNGKVFVRENAHGTDAQQSNKNLLLSNEARVDTKPQLEIYNDDVKCAHGATVGQLEEEELFYLLARGLPENLARNLLTYGFAEEIINKIEIESIKKELDTAVLNRLGTELGV